MYVQVCAGLAISLGRVILFYFVWWTVLLIIVSACIGWTLGYYAGGEGQ